VPKPAAPIVRSERDVTDTGKPRQKSWKGPRRVVGAWIGPDVLLALRIEAADRGTSISATVAEILTAWAREWRASANDVIEVK
jgi:hypothetical protein